MLSDIYSTDIKEWNNSQIEPEITDAETDFLGSSGFQTMPDCPDEIFRNDSTNIENIDCF